MNELEILNDYTRTVEEIASLLSCSVPTVVRKRRKFGIVGPTGCKPNPTKTKKCLLCEKDFLYTIPYQKNKKFCDRKCYMKSKKGIQPISSDVLRKIDRSYMQTEEYRKKRQKKDTHEYKRYANRVHRVSHKIYEENKEKLNPNNFPRTLCGVEGGYQLDHIISVRYGFDNNISVSEIATLENLRIIPWLENLKKR